MARKTRVAPVALTAFLTGCAAMQINSTISQYEDVAPKVDLGDSKEEALSLLLPTQSELSSKYKKRPEKYMKEGTKVEIYYMRARRVPDGLTTDDEFVPYVFNDGRLVGIGWQVLGGPKTQGEASSDTYINNQTTTIVY